MSDELQRVMPIALVAPPAPSLPGEALERLPSVAEDADPYWRLVTAFSSATRRTPPARTSAT